jgi:tetraacyldisaccharide 4'-kinase
MSAKSERPRLERLWRRELTAGDRLRWIPLTGAAALFRGAVAVRNLWWRWRAAESPVPVVSVGNLTVGGAAKTPFTLYLARRLQRRGLTIAIVSRGYGRRSPGAPAALVADRGELRVAPDQSGDEPAMMARSFDGPIAVARRRIDAIRLLAERGPLDAVILDDGFQHVRLRRAVDLVLVSRERGFGNGWMLPAGPMREPLGSLRRADAVVLMSAGGRRPPALDQRALAALQRRTLLHATLAPRALLVAERGAWRETSPLLAGRRVFAVSGIADPMGFHATLRELDADLVGVLEFPDHHAYTHADWQTIAAAARDADLIVTTEKDLIKLERFPFPRDSLYALRLEVTMAEEDARVLDELIMPRLGAPAATRPAQVQEVSRDAR